MNDDLVDYFEIELDDTTYNSTAGILSGSFINSQSEKALYSEINLIEFDGENIGRGKTLQDMLSSEQFKRALFDIIEFGLTRYEEKYRSPNHPFRLYEKYTRKDACRLLNWPTDNSSTVYGYRINYDTCPIFVTYNKEDDIASSTQYEDRFIDPDTFSWMTRSRLTLDSDEVRKIINAKETGIDVHLFAKKSDNEGGDFYYLGPVTPKTWRQTTILDDDGNELPIVNFELQLETTVKDDIYEYFTGNAA